jgi:hypothetical protein
MISTFLAVLLKDLKVNFELEAPIFTSFHIISLTIFILAIIHTLFSYKFTEIAYRIEKNHKQRRRSKKKKTFYIENGISDKSFWAEIFYFLGEVEVIFGIYVIPLIIAIVSFYDWSSAVAYIDSRNYTEAIFVVIIMCIASTRPVLRLAEQIIEKISRFFGNRVSTWWLVLLIIGPLMGSFITEAGAMTLTAILLAKKFYELQPSTRLRYGTLGLLFANVSVGGVLTNFAAPPVLIISSFWGWSSWHMFMYFGWKVLLGIAIANATYYIFFRKELSHLTSKHGELQKKSKEEPVPLWITTVHVLMLIWIVVTEQFPSIFMGSFLLFLGFIQATSPHQYPLNLKKPLLVGFFLAGLVIHGGLQGWWIIPLLGKLQEGALMLTGAALTAFNDNAAVTYLATLIPDMPSILRHAIVSGVIAGGGLTVIANAPNPAGLSLLKKHFPEGISSVKLFLAALIPSFIYFCIFYFSLSG